MRDLIIFGIGISEKKNDGIIRFERYCNYHNLAYRIVGEGEIWNGGNMKKGPGGGQKIIELEKNIRNMDNKLIIVCDTFDLFPIADKKEIIQKFNNLTKENQVLFSAEVYCWPDTNLISQYPINNNKYKYLNSGGFMGYRDDIYKLICKGNINSTDDDQLYFTKKYLNNENIVLDHYCEIFQNLNGCTNDITIFNDRIYNTDTKSLPILIHGNGPSKTYLNKIQRCFDKYLNIYKPSKEIFVALYFDSNKLSDYNKLIENIKHMTNIYFYDEQYNENLRNTIINNNLVYVPYISKYIDHDFKISECKYYLLITEICNIDFINTTSNTHKISSNNNNMLFEREILDNYKIMPCEKSIDKLHNILDNNVLFINFK